MVIGTYALTGTSIFGRVYISPEEPLNILKGGLELPCMDLRLENKTRLIILRNKSFLLNKHDSSEAIFIHSKKLGTNCIETHIFHMSDGHCE